MNMLETLKQPLPWYIAGVLIGLTVPALLFLGNKRFGISSSLKHICAACIPAKIPYFNYDWKKDAWNLFFVGGIAIGAFIAQAFLTNPNAIEVSPATIHDLQTLGIKDFTSLMPENLFSWEKLFELDGFIVIVIGGFLVGFGTRYAGGCTSGHSITGLSNLEWPSLVATICFMVGGIVMTHFILPFILNI